ncbi:hypothetical protein EG867_16010, partial [Enterococcus faecalis]
SKGEPESKDRRVKTRDTFYNFVVPGFIENFVQELVSAACRRAAPRPRSGRRGPGDPWGPRAWIRRDGGSERRRSGGVSARGPRGGDDPGPGDTAATAALRVVAPGSGSPVFYTHTS